MESSPSAGPRPALAGLDASSPPVETSVREYAWSTAFVALATGVGMLVREYVAGPDLAMLYLLAIGVVAARFGRGPSIMASALSVLGYDFFFVQPYYTFAVHDQHHLFTFVMMFGVALVTSAITLRLRRQEREARAREERTAALYALSRDLGSALDRVEVEAVIVRHEAAVSPPGGTAVSEEQRELLEAFARQGALALERARLAEEAEAAALRLKTEEMRSSLLSAVSHDLRTPLAAITGAATMLRDGTGVAPDQRADFVDTICEEAERLERLVSNLLDMTRLSSGTLEVNREWVPLEEIVGSVLTRLETQLAGRAIRTELPPDLPLVSVDPVLIEQLFVNLLENARKYTPAGSPLTLRARVDNGATTIEVADRGPGLPPGTHVRVFEKFFRGAKEGTAGVGLGLAICRGIAEAHGGTLIAEDRPGGGALFRLTLPAAGTVPAMPPDLEPESAVAGATP